jgi:transposase
MKESIGIDVSMETLDVALYDGKAFTINRYNNNEKGFSKIEKDLLVNDNSDYIITMEATGIYHLKAAIYFQEKGYTVSVVNPLIIKRYSEMKMLRAKTDSVDARLIAEYGFNEKPRYFIRKDEKREQIIQLLKQIDALQEMQSENRNRLHALERIPGASEIALSIYREIGNDLKAKECEAEKAVEKILKDYYDDENKRLREIPGVGKKIAPIIIAFFGTFENFENAKQVSSFIGLNPSLRQSGISLNGKGFISKKGNRYMRKMFYMASLSASRYNKACAELYRRCLARGKNKRVALVAVANKLVRQIFAIMKHGRNFDENYCIFVQSA